MEEKMKTGGIVSGSSTLLEEMKILKEMQDQTGVRKNIHSELWHACAGPLVSLPHVGSLVYYFPQGHIEQVTISTKRPANSPVLNYPNLPPQIVCQVHNVTMHADKDTDEIFAQMSLQPIQSEKDALPTPEFGSKSSEHPAEFFCKTLTASDTSSHGGFSVPRRAAEKLFPPLDYSTQPPSQELIVRDLHDNTWTFRHVFRGQPKRHLLTTGWSTFVSSKRLRAGDSVLFIRNEKSQLMVGVRRANRQQTTLPSSVLSADTMYIGVLAAAAHAATNRSTFTVFYNPRACPSAFVIPVYKYRKAVHGVQISAGMRFGMMFETEESGKRRYMGTILGVNDLDPLRWPSSKWRTLQVEWDEAGCSDKPKRVSHWEIETPENLFLFSSLTSGFKHPFIPRYMGVEFEWGNPMKKPFIPAPDSGFGTLPYPSLPNLYSEQLMKMLLKPQTMNIPPANMQINAFVNTSPTCLDRPAHGSLRVEEPQVNKTNTNQTPPSTTQEKAKNVDHVVAVGSQKAAESGSTVKCNEVKGDVSGSTCNPVISSMNVANLNGILPHVDVPDWVPYATASTLQTSPIVSLPSGMDSNMLPAMGQELWSQQLAGSGASQSHQDPAYVQCEPNMNGLLGMSGDTNTQSGIYSCMEFDGATNCGSMMLDPSVSNALLGDLGTLKDAAFQYSTDCLLGNFGSSQDLQSQITSASLADFPDSSGGTSTSNVEFDESSLLQNKSWQQVIPPMRTYTKVQKAGSVGRSIDVTSFRTYDELRSEIERMFGLHGVLNDPRGVGWKLVYVDFENDVLLVGDDPWEEFVSCVRCIRILSPAEVEQMSLEGMQVL